MLSTQVLFRKDEIRPRTDPQGEYMYRSTLSLTAALDGSGWLTPPPGRLTPGKETRYPLGLRQWVPGPVWMCAESRLHRDFLILLFSLYPYLFIFLDMPMFCPCRNCTTLTTQTSRIPSKRSAADPFLRQIDYWDRRNSNPGPSSL